MRDEDARKRERVPTALERIAEHSLLDLASADLSGGVPDAARDWYEQADILKELGLKEKEEEAT